MFRHLIDQRYQISNYSEPKNYLRRNIFNDLIQIKLPRRLTPSSLVGPMQPIIKYIHAKFFESFLLKTGI